jgi:hypothetical protein
LREDPAKAATKPLISRLAALGIPSDIASGVKYHDAVVTLLALRKRQCSTLATDVQIRGMIAVDVPLSAACQCSVEEADDTLRTLERRRNEIRIPRQIAGRPTNNKGHGRRRKQRKKPVRRQTPSAHATKARAPQESPPTGRFAYGVRKARQALERSRNDFEKRREGKRKLVTGERHKAVQRDFGYTGQPTADYLQPMSEKYDMPEYDLQ